MSIKTNLIKEFESELEELKKMQVGTDDYKITVDGVTKLADRIIEIEKNEKEHDAQIDAQEREHAIKAQALKDEKRDKLIKNCVTVGTFLGSVAVYSLAFIATTNFEREGTFTTEGGRNSIKNLLKLTN